MLLTEYLDMKNTRTASEPSAQLSYASTGREFAAFFAKKKPQRPKNSLFKFESSSHAISMSAYLREQRRELYSRSGELQASVDKRLKLSLWPQNLHTCHHSSGSSKQKETPLVSSA
ncbi:Exocyst complex component 4 [Myotis brandtii]|uniref:Exocyst complex component 4 n=1 Tax=Myotis brandtii TaxID=109478 RepID=S7Q9P9_MYOBR|nr:Exocyst complex component 4 [Myotis brandtii]